MRFLRFLALGTVGFVAYKLVQSHRHRRLFHVILFKFKKDASIKDIHAVESRTIALKDEIEFIEHLEYGTNLPHEHRNKGFTHCAIYTFKSKKDFRAYKDHSIHQAFLEFISPYVEDTVVVDFYAD